MLGHWPPFASERRSIVHFAVYGGHWRTGREFREQSEAATRPTALRVRCWPEADVECRECQTIIATLLWLR